MNSETDYGPVAVVYDAMGDRPQISKTSDEKVKSQFEAWANGFYTYPLDFSRDVYGHYAAGLTCEKLAIWKAALASTRDEIEVLKRDAARWSHARMLFAMDDIEGRDEDFRSFGYFADEEENKRADEAIDAAIAAMKGRSK